MCKCISFVCVVKTKWVLVVWLLPTWGGGLEGVLCCPWWWSQLERGQQRHLWYYTGCASVEHCWCLWTMDVYRMSALGQSVSQAVPVYTPLQPVCHPSISSRHQAQQQSLSQWITVPIKAPSRCQKPLPKQWVHPVWWSSFALWGFCQHLSIIKMLLLKPISFSFLCSL